MEKPILVAEDEESDAVLLRMAARRIGLANPIFIVRDGQDVVNYLSGRAPFDDRVSHPVPGLLLLDLKMPRMTGFDVLRWLRARPELHHLPTVALSSSDDPNDIESVLALGANEYRVKPHGLDRLSELLAELSSRWLPQA